MVVEMSKKVKLAFDLVGTGWKTPVETVWADRITENKYKLLNSPFYAYGFSLGDIVSATEKEGQLFVSGMVERGGHSTYRIFLNKMTIPEDLSSFLTPIVNMGCTYEQAYKSLYSIDVPPGVDVRKIYHLLEEGDKNGVWKFEEAHYNKG